MKIQQINKKTGSRKILEVLRQGEYGARAPGMMAFLLDKPFSQGRSFRHFLIGRGGKKRQLKVENLCSEHIYHMIASYVEEVAPSAQGKTKVKTRSRQEVSAYGLDLSKCDLTFEAVPDRPGWFRGPLCDMYQAEDLAIRLNIDLAPPPECRLLAGLFRDDLEHRIFITPFLSVREVVEIFRVGAYIESTHGGDPDEMVARVAQGLTDVEKVSPLLIYRADDGDFFADFVRPVTKAQAVKIDKIFATDDPIRDGLEIYVNKWSGKGGLMTATVFEDQGIQLMWDRQPLAPPQEGPET